jgi:hypothetical protein
MSRHLGHLPEDAIVQRGLANLGNKVLLDHSDRRNHLSSLFLNLSSLFLKMCDAQIGKD